MKVEKSSRHTKIIGNFGEHLVCNWLSRSGFEVTHVDHTGIDVLAYHRETKKRLGITVKSRTRNHGEEGDHVKLLYGNSRKLLGAACVAFGCEPWLAVYVETEGFANLFLMSVEDFDKTYACNSWKMTEASCSAYENDPHIKHIKFDFHGENWW